MIETSLKLFLKWHVRGGVFVVVLMIIVIFIDYIISGGGIFILLCYP